MITIKFENPNEKPAFRGPFIYVELIGFGLYGLRPHHKKPTEIATLQTNGSWYIKKVRYQSMVIS